MYITVTMLSAATAREMEATIPSTINPELTVFGQ